MNDEEKLKKEMYIEVFYRFKIDLLLNSLSPKIKSTFNKVNKTGKRLEVLAKWQRDYIQGLTNEIPKEINLMAKELKIL